MTKQLQVQYLNKNTNTSVVGTTPNYLEVRKYELEAGRMFSTADDMGTSARGGGRAARW